MSRPSMRLCSLMGWSWVLVAAVVLLTGCGILCPSSLPDLQVAGAKKLAVPSPCSIDRNHCPGVIDLIAPLYPATGVEGGNTPQILLSQDGTFYIERLDDNVLRRLDLPRDCAGVVALAPDRQELGCVADTEQCVDCFTVCTFCSGKSIVSASLLQGEIGQERELVPQQDGVELGVFSWSPDAKHLAAIRRQIGEPLQPYCSLAIYTAQASPEPFALSALIPLSPEISPCDQFSEIAQVLWSPDGSWIAFSTWGYEQINTVYAIPVASLPAGALTVAPKPLVIDITPKVVITTYTGSAQTRVESPQIGWMPDGHVLSLSTENGYDIVGVDIASGMQRTVLKLPSDASPVRQLAWAPDGQQLFFSIGHGGEGVCAGPHDDVYSYSSPPFGSLPTTAPIVPVTPIPMPTWTPERPTPVPTDIV